MGFGRLAEIWWSVCMSKSHSSLCVSFSRTNSELGIYHLFVWSNFKFFHNYQWITFLTQSCLVLYSLCANLLNSLIMWLIVSSLSQHNLHLLFCCTLFIRGTHPSFHILSVLFSGQPGQQNRQFCWFSFFFFFLLVIIRSGLLAEIRWSVCMSKSHRSLCVSFSGTGAELCIYNLLVWSNLNFLHISQWISPYTPSVLICYIRLLCEWSLRLCHRIVYICYFVEFCLFSLWYDWFLWRCPVLLLGKIPFLS